MEDQSLAGHGAPRRIGHARRQQRGSGQHILRRSRWYTPIARRFRAGPARSSTTWPRAVMWSTCACPPSLPAWLPAGSRNRSTSLETEVAVPVSATTLPADRRASPPCARRRSTSSRPRARESPKAQPDLPRRIFAVQGSAALLTSTTRTGSAAIRARATSVCRFRSSTITGAATELACCQSRAWPRKVASPVAWCSCASAATTCAGPWPPRATAALPSLGRPAARFRLNPAGLHIAMRKGVARGLRNIDLVRRKLQSAVFHARTQRQVQPLARAFIDGAARRRPHRRRHATPGLAGGSWTAQHAHPRLPIGSAPRPPFPAFACPNCGRCHKMRLKPVAAAALPRSRRGGLFHARVANAGHGGQHRSLGQTARSNRRPQAWKATPGPCRAGSRPLPPLRRCRELCPAQSCPGQHCGNPHPPPASAKCGSLAACQPWSRLPARSIASCASPRPAPDARDATRPEP